MKEFPKIIEVILDPYDTPHLEMIDGSFRDETLARVNGYRLATYELKYVRKVVVTVQKPIVELKREDA